MRVEQQTNVKDAIVDSAKWDEREKININIPVGTGSTAGIGAFGEKIVEKAGKSDPVKSVNVKDATYGKPENEEKKTLADELENVGQMDAAERKNQMAVLANTTSPEDYAKMQEEGFSLDETTSNTIITETDKIKAQLAKAGVDISFFGDDLDMEQLEAIAGSPELATQIVQALERADLPCTGENIKEALEAFALAGTLQKPGNGAIRYMLDNGLVPTIENLYKAEFSGSGSYPVDEGAAVDMSSFMEQVERIILRSGFEVNEQSKADCQWMLENGVPLNEENLKLFEALKNLTLPVENEILMESIAVAISEGGRPRDAMLAEGYTLMEQAEEALSVVNQATDEDLAYIIENGMEVTVRNLAFAIASRAKSLQAGSETGVSAAFGAAGATSVSVAAGEVASASGSVAGTTGVSMAAGTSVAAEDTVNAAGEAAVTGAAATGETSSMDISVTGAEEAASDPYTKAGLALLTARRQLEEVRLAMTAQANYALLKKGIQIDTEPLVKLVEELKASENEYYENLLRAQGADASEENVQIFRETTEKVSDLKMVPAYVLGMKQAQNVTVAEVHKAGEELRDTFERANERYETLMTAPRADLGDSIQKAFQNVDDILEDIGLEATEANRRAVRILAYNQLEITPEAVARMKNTDEEVQRAFRNMTPAVVAQMIKRGINPLDMNFEGLNETAEQIGEELGTQDERRFGEFLWKLEKSNAISEEERASYIGIYRLIHQVEKSDGAVIGALVNQGAEITMRNLMMAVRNGNHSGKMDFTVDESFGEGEGGGYTGTSIIEQIESAYQNNCIKDVADALTPERLKTVMQQPDWEGMTPEQLKEALAEAETGDAELDYAYAREQLAELEQSAKVAQDIYAVLERYDIPNTMSNVMAMESMIRNRNGMFRQIFGSGVKDAHEEHGTDDLEEMKEELLEEFGKAVSAPEKLAEAQKKLGEVAENVMRNMIESDDVTSLDVREMRLLSAQLSMSSLLAKEEQYSVPVMVSDGVVNVSLKIVRGGDKKGIVDIMMESGQRGRIAATFQAKERGVKGLVATDNPETEELLKGQGVLLAQSFGEEEQMDIHYAHISDLDLNQFSMGMHGGDAAEQDAADKGTETYQVQTARLYHIAESFIQQIREVL